MSQEIKKVHELWELRQWQSLPLEAKVLMTQRRIKAWHEYWQGQVHISFSGGKDSTVLLHIARQMYPDIKAVFVNTGLEYPEVRQFARSVENVDTVQPLLSFIEVIKRYGYPFISKEVSKVLYGFRHSDRPSYKRKMDGVNADGSVNKFTTRYKKYKPMLDLPIEFSNRCCYHIKEKPAITYESKNKTKPIIATMAEDSEQRQQGWLKSGCNAFTSNRPQSKPMSFWTEQDVLQYLKQNNLEVASVYGELTDCDGCLHFSGCQRTGCTFCAFGAHLDTQSGGTSRFVLLKQTHPRLYDFCMEGGEFNENGMWQPNAKGLGMRFVIDELNKLFTKKYKNGKIKRFIEI
jgi:3'-phosphoadenosine 5'-phosphosulfate sulfotransferase (PAPS reductase)/FAD synthetase